MNQKNNDNQLTKLTRATRQRTKNLAARGISKAGEIQQSVEKRLTRALQSGANTLVEQLTNPKNAVFLQDQLVKIAQLGFTFGFKIDPNAEKLYNFVQWVEERHGREPVMALVLSQNLLADGRMVQLLTAYATFLSSPAALSGKAPDWKTDEIEQFKEQAGYTLLTMLCELAALEHDLPLPDGTTSEKIEFFESAPIPEEFKILAAMAAGRRPDAIIMPGQKPKTDPTDPERTSRLNRLAQSILGSTQKILGTPGTTEDVDAKPTGLARFIPGLNDPTFHFIVFSYTFFLETFMLRNLIENLPEILGGIAPLAQNNDPSEHSAYDENAEDYQDHDVYKQTDYTDINDSGADS